MPEPLNRVPRFLTRRHFLSGITAGAAALRLWPGAVAAAAVPERSAFVTEAEPLLHAWGDALLRLQVNNPARPEAHGAFRCPACGVFHGRCGDAVLPLLTLAARTGKAKYKDAALRAAAWTKNVDAPDGSWTNDLDPKSWKGTTVFAAIAFAESLQWHSDLLDEPTRAAWRARLKRAGDFILAKFNTDYGNINYSAAGSYGLALLGRLLNEPAFTKRGRELANQVAGFFTPKDHFLFGEGHPMDRRTDKGCYPVDLGYNVEESLPSLVSYALLENDAPILEAACRSLQTHLEFMLPDGAWDNSWGTRSFKWPYWGSRTSDGCQAAFVRLADRDPVFMVAALCNLRQLRDCTHDGLLHGGPHLHSHGVPPCVHHTFCHAKALAAALHESADRPEPPVTPLPREKADGIRTFTEIDTHLAALGPWRATVTGYDFLYKPELFHPTGGALSVLWHRDLGLLACGSLARYVMAEAHNMQPNPDGEDVPLTPRIEVRDGAEWYTNLHDLKAQLRCDAQNAGAECSVDTTLVNAKHANPAAGPLRFHLTYRFTPDAFTLIAQPAADVKADWSLVFPLVSPTGEPLREISPNQFEIQKPGGTVVLTSSVPLTRLTTARDRVFNPVPGAEAIPFVTNGRGAETIELRIQKKA